MSQPFTTLAGTATPLPEENIDTDIIFPARFLLITAREGLGRHAFHDRRFAADGSERADCVFNQEPYRNAPFIVAGANFGSGSSREQAVWALAGLGVRCVIAPGFGEIFHANCLRNGILPITLPAETVATLQGAAATGQLFSVDLATQSLTAGNRAWQFAIPEERKLALLNGWDETALLLNQFGGAIEQFETGQKAACPWLYPEEG